MELRISTWIKQWEWFFPAVALAMCGITVAAFFMASTEKSINPWALTAVLLTSAAIMFWGIYAFTGELNSQCQHGVRFAYFVMVISLASTLLPLMITNEPIGGEPIGIVSGCVASEQVSSLLACKTPSGTDKRTNNQWLLNIGGSLTKQQDPAPAAAPKPSMPERVNIEGGIVVPLPFLVIAMFGGAISLSRRIPELQKRAESSYISVPDAPKLGLAEFRERMVFQIVQYASAPMIAIVAYQSFKPDSESSAAVLGFMCGFGSETVLLMVRGLMDGIKPRGTGATGNGSIRGVVKQAGAVVAGAQVTVGGTGRNTVTDQYGCYDLVEIPSGQQALVIVNGATTKNISLNVSAGNATICNIDMDLDAATADVVQVRLTVDMNNIEAGSLALKVNDQVAEVGEDGFLELELETNKEHLVTAVARRNGADVHGELRLHPVATDDGRSYELIF